MTIGVDGFKLSNELFQFRIDNFGDVEATLSFFKNIVEHRININYLSRTVLNGNISTTCCVASEAQEEIKVIIETQKVLKNLVIFTPSVGLLSFYPHRFNIKILGKSLIALGKAGVPIHGIATSLSSITFITDYVRLNEARNKLRDCFSATS